MPDDPALGCDSNRSVVRVASSAERLDPAGREGASAAAGLAGCNAGGSGNGATAHALSSRAATISGRS
ncbi:MAG: hypothetical protein PHC88_08705 [Terrimicrobiaceae bacterium]|nr:hypothetical protein [Terrimicrobiaceae bacterium]